MMSWTSCQLGAGLTLVSANNDTVTVASEFRRKKANWAAVAAETMVGLATGVP